MAPRFRSGDFAGGINAGVDAIMKAIEGEALPPPAARQAGAQGRHGLVVRRFPLPRASSCVPIVAMVLRRMFGPLVGAGAHRGASPACAAWFIFGSLVVGGRRRARRFRLHALRGSGTSARARRGGWRRLRPGGWGGGGWFGGGGGGGGGFSGGGGGFDGGGASGSW